MFIPHLDPNALGKYLPQREQSVPHEFARRAHGLDLGRLQTDDLMPLLVDVGMRSQDQRSK